MRTVLFDFDSTLIVRESLDELLAMKLAGRPALLARLHAVTAEGMEGRIGFAESLSTRLAMAAPTRSDIERLGAMACDWATPGMDRLIDALHHRGDHVWIVSGGIREAILPLAERFRIAPVRVLAATLNWDDRGEFAGIDLDEKMNISKTEGIMRFLPQMPGRKVAVGDGMTDYELYRTGLVDKFIAFTQHARRSAVVSRRVPEASDVHELARLLEEEG